MSVYCRLGSGLWTWDPWTSLDPTTRLLWLALYSSGEAKRLIPGLWHGSVHAMADAARLPADDVVRSLDRLLEHELVEYDRSLRVLRLTELPDAGESPSTGNAIRGWFTKFRSVPACQVRDAHVPTLRWILDEWSRESGKPISADHQKAWSETFGDAAKVKVPPPRKRGVRRLIDARQPDLFESLPTKSCPQPEVGSVDNSDSPHQPKEIRDSEYLGDTFAKVLDQDQDHDLDQVFPEGGVQRGRPMLTLVPSPADAPFTMEQLLGALDTRGAQLNENERRALADALVVASDAAVGEEPVEILKHVASSRITARNAACPGVLRAEFERARKRCVEARERSAVLREAREKAGV